MNDRYLSKLSARHQQMARLYVGGTSQAEIAKLMDIHKSTVSRNLRDPLIRAEIGRLQKMADVHSTACVPGVSETIQEGAHKGARLLIEIIDDERMDPVMMKLKANVSLELLDRAGYAPIKQMMVESASVSYLTAEDIEEMKIKAGLA